MRSPLAPRSIVTGVGLGLVLGALLTVALEHEVLGWGTRLDDGTQWKSMYVGRNARPQPGTSRGFSHNEHAELADLALRSIGVGDAFSMGSGESMTVTDFNASLYRPGLRSLGTVVDDPNDSPLERRTIPPPPHWSGIPDFSYTIYDWINKNTLCPSRPEGNDWLCHSFKGWLGAGFNSSHFGTQATASYRALHATARLLATDARVLREAIERSEHPTDLEALRDFVEEAELMALAYEGYAQHFLQDRWSTGHMWERWSAGDYASNPYRDALLSSFEVGAAAGLLHGSEELTKSPDPMSSPEVASGGIEPAQWREGPDGPVFNGVGDHRLIDLMDGYFDADGIDRPLATEVQKRYALDCLGAGWMEVVRGFGRSDRTGGYGIRGLEPTASYTGFGDVGHDCFHPWATNRAIRLGWVGDWLRSLAMVARLALTRPDALDELASGFQTNRTAWVKVTAYVRWYAWSDPSGTNLARGDIGSFGRALHGGNYGAPDYLEPPDLDLLPEEDARGRDKRTLFGFFNRARAAHFCTDVAERLRPLRGLEDVEERETCRILADRVYRGTDPDYEGRQREVRAVGGDPARPANPVCWLLDPPARVRFDDVRDDVPVYLRPGYVGDVPRIRRQRPYGRARRDVTSQSVANWCDALPVLHLLETPEERDADVVALIEDPDEEITVTGVDLGDEQGELALVTDEGDRTPVTDLDAWSDDEIVFRLPDGTDVPDDGVRLEVTRADRVFSVGRFVLRRDVETPEIASIRVSRGDEVFYRFRDEPPGTAPASSAEAERDPDPFRPIPPGEVAVEIAFRTPMDPEGTPGREGEEQAFRLGPLALDGEWVDETTWRGTAEVPESPEAFGALRGFQPLAIQARTPSGGWLDGDPETPDHEPDTTHRVLVDAIPIHVTRVRATAEGREVYRAAWTGGVDLDAEPNLTSEAVGSVPRTLQVPTAREVPPSGEGRISIELSGPVEDAPAIEVGAATATVEGEGTEWTGRFDLAVAADGAREGRIPIRIEARDRHGRGLDGDPRTVPAIVTGGDDDARWWLRYEDERNGRVTPVGGVDTWHELGEPPVTSLVIVLDGSGSMEEEGRMEKAKSGIARTLAGLPEGVELAAVVFEDCGSIRVAGFTEDRERIRSFLLSTTPSGGTDYAASLDVARRLLASSAHPASRRWRYAPYTDGYETCDGNVAGATRRLDASIAGHERMIASLEPEEEPDEPPPPEPDEEPPVACHPASWRRYAVEIDDGGRHLDRIDLVELSYHERRLPDGRCMARLVRTPYGVHYGAGSRDGPVRWAVNSRPGRERVELAVSGRGAGELERVRESARTAFESSVGMDLARTRIDEAVRANVP